MQRDSVEQTIAALKIGKTNKHKRAAIADLDVARLEELRDGLIKLLRIVSIAKGHNDNNKTKGKKREILNILRFDGISTTSLVEKKKKKRGLIDLTDKTAPLYGISVHKSLVIDHLLLIAIDKRIKQINKILKLIRQFANKPFKQPKRRNIDLMHPDRINKLVRLFGIFMNLLSSPRFMGRLESQTDTTLTYHSDVTAEDFIHKQLLKDRLVYTWSRPNEINNGYLSYFPAMATTSGTLVDSIINSGLMSDDMVMSMFSTTFNSVYPESVKGTRYDLDALRDFVLNDLLISQQDVIYGSERMKAHYDVITRILSDNYDADTFRAVQDDIRSYFPKYATQNLKRSKYVSAKYLSEPTSVIGPTASITLDTYGMGDRLDDGTNIVGIFVSMSAKSIKTDYTDLAIDYTICSPDMKLRLSHDKTSALVKGEVKLVKARPSSLRRINNRGVDHFDNLDAVTRFLSEQRDYKEYYVAMYFDEVTPFSDDVYKGANIINNLYNAKFRVYYRSSDNGTKTVGVSKESMTNSSNLFKAKNIINVLLDADIDLFKPLTDFKTIYIVPTIEDNKVKYINYVQSAKVPLAITDDNKLSELYSRISVSTEAINALTVLPPEEFVESIKFTDDTTQVLMFGTSQAVGTNVAAHRIKSMQKYVDETAYSRIF